MCWGLEERTSPNDLEAPPREPSPPITGQCLANELGLLHQVRGSNKRTREVDAVEVATQNRKTRRQDACQSATGQGALFSHPSNSSLRGEVSCNAWWELSILYPQILQEMNSILILNEL